MKRGSAVLLAAVILLTGCKKTESEYVTIPAVSSLDTGTHENAGGGVTVIGSTPISDSLPETDGEEIIGDYETEPEGGGVTITRYLGKENEKVSVPGMIKGKEVLRIGEYAFRGVNVMKSLVIPSTVVEIDNRAFTDCSDLKRVTVAEGVRVINDYAFSDCAKLEIVELPGTVREIGSGAFNNCPSVKVEYKGKSYTQVNMKELYEVF